MKSLFNIPDPLSIVTDRELALMNALDTYLPNSNHLLCMWHVNMNILANCRKHFRPDPTPEDITAAQHRNPSQPPILANQEWVEFL